MTSLIKISVPFSSPFLILYLRMSTRNRSFGQKDADHQSSTRRMLRLIKMRNCMML